MSIWNVRVTIAELGANTLTEQAMLRYYLASSIFTLIVLECQFWMGPDREWEIWVDFLMNLVVIVGGVDHCWRANGGASGRDFIKRIVCLSVPVGIWMAIVSAWVGLVNYAFKQSFFTGNYFANPEEARRLVNLLVYIALAVCFWRWLAQCMCRVATMNP